MVELVCCYESRPQMVPRSAHFTLILRIHIFQAHLRVLKFSRPHIKETGVLEDGDIFICSSICASTEFTQLFKIWSVGSFLNASTKPSDSLNPPLHSCHSTSSVLKCSKAVDSSSQGCSYFHRRIFPINLRMYLVNGGLSSKQARLTNRNQAFQVLDIGRFRYVQTCGVKSTIDFHVNFCLKVNQ